MQFRLTAIAFDPNHPKSNFIAFVKVKISDNQILGEFFS
jgi:hypothetical protein